MAEARERGLALITAMLVVAIAATVAAFLALGEQLWLRQAQNLADRAQALYATRAAVDWAQIILARAARDNPNDDDLTQAWASPLPPLPVEGGRIAGQITDAQGLFNLNDLLRNGAPSPGDIGIFQRLLIAQGLSPDLVDAVLDWIDPDSVTRPHGAEDIDYLQLDPPYRAANQWLASVDELRLIKGFTAAAVEKLRPYVTVLPTPTDINVNTAPPGVLSALFGNLSPEAINSLTQGSGGRPFTDLGKLSQAVQRLSAGTPLATGGYGIHSAYFIVTVETEFGRYRQRMQALLQRAPDGTVNELWLSQQLPTTIAAPKTDGGDTSGIGPS